MNTNANFDFMSNDTRFAAEGSSESTAKKELTPFQKGVLAVTGVGIAATAVGVGVYWANRGIRETADNIADGVDACKAAHERRVEKKARKAAIEAALNQNA